MEIDWSKIRTMNGTAANVPQEVARLLLPDAEDRHRAYWSLDGEIVNSGGLYEASFYAIPLLVELIESNPLNPGIEKAYDLLVEICASYALDPKELETTEWGLLDLRVACHKQLEKGADVYRRDLSSDIANVSRWAADILDELEKLGADTAT